MKLAFLINFLAIILSNHFLQDLTKRYGEEAMKSVVIEEELTIEKAKCLMNDIENEHFEKIESHIINDIPDLSDITDPLARCKLGLEFHKLLNISKIPFIRESSYPKKHLKFLQLMQTLLKQDAADYPRINPKKNILILSKDALFKPSIGERDNEIAIWDLSFLFGIEDIFVPTAPIIVQNQRGLLQSRIKNEILGADTFNKRLDSWITRSSFLHATLAILLFALEDIHNENLAYTLVKNGYFAIKLFDTENAFKQVPFYRFYKLDLLTIHTPYAFCGWDYPQAKMNLTKEEAKTLTILAQKWSCEDLIAYAKHPLTPLVFTNQTLQEMINRMKILKKCFQRRPTALELLEALEPSSPKIRSKIEQFFPGYGPSYVLFQLLWRPQLVREWLPPEQKKKLDEWIEIDFFEQTPL